MEWTGPWRRELADGAWPEAGDPLAAVRSALLQVGGDEIDVDIELDLRLRAGEVDEKPLRERSRGAARRDRVLGHNLSGARDVGTSPTRSTPASRRGGSMPTQAVVFHPRTELVLTNRQLGAGPTERLVSVQRGLGQR
jgi:hypothetical protein